MRLGVRGRAVLPLYHALLQPSVPFDVPSVEDRTRFDQCRGGHDQPGRPDESEPFQVSGDMGVGLRHGGAELLGAEDMNGLLGFLPIDEEVRIEGHDGSAQTLHESNEAGVRE